MGTYIKDFETHSAYNTYITGGDKVLPNVSYCEDQNEVHYNPFEPPSHNNIFTFATPYNIPIGGYGIPSEWLFDENGNALQFTLSYDSETGIETATAEGDIYRIRSVNASAFSGVTDVTFPQSLAILDQVLSGSNIVNVTIPSGVIQINGDAFAWCPSLETITVLSTTPPVFGGGVHGVFSNSPNLTTIYVPAASVDAYKSAWSGASSLIQAIPA